MEKERGSSSKLSPVGFATAMAQFYRSEVGRSNTWRSRLDTTTNWAVIISGATLSFTFSDPAHPHFVIPLNSLLVSVFLYMEARRYRYYEIWSSRARLVEKDYFASLLRPQGAGDQECLLPLSDYLLQPAFTISMWEAIGRRLRRNYLVIFMLLGVCWVLKIYLQPQPARDFHEFITRTGVGLIPGWIVLTLGIIFNGTVVAVALATIHLREAKGTRVR